MNNKVLVLGNGFDIDLGLKTKYRDFADSEFWPFNDDSGILHPENNRATNLLRDVLNERKLDVSTWFDLESIMAEFAVHGSTTEFDGHDIGQDRRDYDVLVESLSSYLNKIQQENIKEDSIAAIVLRAIIQNGYFSEIYSFNYTDLHLIARKLRIPNDFKYSHVHGSLAEKSIILGIESKSQFDTEYRFMCKEYNPNYRSHLIRQRLEAADEVVFFGHGLSKIDYHYFERLFSMCSTEAIIDENHKWLSFFTYDEFSRMDLLDRLQEMNNRRLDLMFGNNQLQFFKTKDGLTPQLNKYLQHLKDTSKAAHREQMRRIASRL